jgi:hypothetical protein
MEALSSEVANESRTPYVTSKKTRKEIASALIEFETITARSSQRIAAELLGIPRSTLRHWTNRKKSIDLPDRVVTFFESPEGAEFLHRLVTAMLFVMSQLGHCGIRLVGLLLKLCQLNRFVGGSIGSLQKLNVKMEEEIVSYEEQERERLSKDMPTKKITACADETFHPKPCLVAIEPVSNFILTEKYSEKRDAESWSVAIKEGLKDLQVEVIQATSDEGKGLIKFVEKELGAHHSPDLFHVQQELSRATSAPLNAKLTQAEREYKESCMSTGHCIKEKELYAQAIQRLGRPPDFDQRIAEAKAEETFALLNLEEAKKRKEDTQKAKKALGDAYHPYNLETGKSQTAKKVGAKLENQFLIIKRAAEEAGLSENSHKRLEKAHRVFKSMVATIAFFWMMIKAQVKELELPAELEELMHNVLIPALYLRNVAKKARGAEQRHKIFGVADDLFKRLDTIGIWCNLDQAKRGKMEIAAKNCAQIFQRSSSCVEGRNGHLSLWHHGLHKLSTRKLKVLTTLHNYYIRGTDGTTAAERFFEQKPNDLFEFLLERFPYPARPATKRTKLAA